MTWNQISSIQTWATFICGSKKIRWFFIFALWPPSEPSCSDSSKGVIRGLRLSEVLNEICFSSHPSSHYYFIITLLPLHNLRRKWSSSKWASTFTSVTTACDVLLLLFSMRVTSGPLPVHWSLMSVAETSDLSETINPAIWTQLYNNHIEECNFPYMKWKEDLTARESILV